MPPLRLVIDTNVALDLLHWQDARVAPLQRDLQTGGVVWLTDAACAGEFARVVAYPEFRLDAARQAALAARYRELASALPEKERRTLPARLPQCRDPDDQKFVELAVAAQADVLLTRDKALLKLARRIRSIAPGLLILTPQAHWQRDRGAAGSEQAAENAC